MTRTQLVLLAAGVVALGLVTGIAVGQRVPVRGPHAGRMTPVWAHRFADLRELVAASDAIVVARVDGTRPGRTVETAEGSLPFTLVDLRVESAVRGGVTGAITLEQTGGGEGDGAVYLDGDGGPYRAGDRVLLFLGAQEGTGLHYLLHPAGRMHVENGRLHAVAPGERAAQALDGLALDEAIEKIRSR